MTEPDWKSWSAGARRKGPRCPDIERLRLWTERGEAPAEAGGPDLPAVGAHVRECARCRREADELRSFFAGTAGGGAAHGADHEAVVHRLRQVLADPERARALPARSSASPAAAPPAAAARLPLWARRPWLVALPAALLVGAGLAFFLSRAPRLGAPPIPVLEPGTGAFRGEVRPLLLEPKGEREAVPRRLSWQSEGEQPGAWIVRLERVDGFLIWSARTSDLFVDLPGSVAGELRPGSRYLWSVEPADHPGARVAASFTIAP